MNMKIIGQRIKNVREAVRDLTQEELAERCGVGVRAISKIECGAAPDVKFSTLNCIANGLGITLSSLVIDVVDDDEYYNAFPDEDVRRVRRNYHDRNTRYDISTFIELVLALPVIDMSSLLNCCALLSGDVIRREEYAAKIFSQALKDSFDDDAKKYVCGLLELLHSNEISSAAPEEVDMVLYDLFHEKNQTDPEFEKKYDAYLELIKRKQASIVFYNQVKNRLLPFKL